MAVFYYIFDLLYLDGYDTTALSLRDRKTLLKGALQYTDALRFTPHRNETGEAYFQFACAHGWEGLVAKRASSTYVSRRSPDWLKFKCSLGQEFVVGGFTDPAGSRVGLGALLVGYYDQGELVYAGKVGTGFSTATLIGSAPATRRSRHRQATVYRGPYRGAGCPLGAPSIGGPGGVLRMDRRRQAPAPSL